MYAWTGHGNGPTAYTQNGLNQQLTVGGAAAAYDTKGNLTTEPQSGKTYGYSSENLLTSATGGVTLAYDPAMRLYQTVGAATTRFLYDGVDAIAEYNASNALQRRFVFDPTTDQPVLWYEGTGTAATNRRYLSQDERGSVISVSGSTGTSLGLNTYDEYGKPGAANIGRYQYTGQKWIGEANLYDYKARDYVPQLGVFAQTDPIGQEAGSNTYVYTQDDPLNLVDPLGLQDSGGGDNNNAPIIITGSTCPNGWSCYDPGYGFQILQRDSSDREIVITGARPQQVKNPASPLGPGRLYTGESPEQQQANCQSNPITRLALGSPQFRASTQTAINSTLAYSSQWEYGFWSFVPASGNIKVWPVSTSRDTWEVSPWMLPPYYFGLLRLSFTRPNVLNHTHIPDSPLSQEDVNFAKENNVSIIASSEGRTYCYP